MYGLKEIPYTARVLIDFLLESDNKNLHFLTFYNFTGYFSCSHFGRHKNLVIYLYSSSSNFIFWVGSLALKNLYVDSFFSLFDKIKDGRQITCYSQELEMLQNRFNNLFHVFFPRWPTNHMLLSRA